MGLTRGDRVLPRYEGQGAATYNDLRLNHPKWQTELRVLEKLLAERTPRSEESVLDLPCGTGRLMPLLSTEFRNIVAMDASSDMIQIVSNEYSDMVRRGQLSVRHGKISHIPLPTNSIDLSICLRLANWLGSRDLSAALSELNRVSRHGVILGVRYWTRRAVLSGAARPQDLRSFAALKAGRQTRRSGRVVLSGSHLARLIHQSGLIPFRSIVIDEREDCTTYVLAHLVPSAPV